MHDGKDNCGVFFKQAQQNSQFYGSCIQQRCIKLIKRGSKTFILLQKISILNKCRSFEHSIHQIISTKHISQFPQNYSAAQQFLTLIIIRNVS